MKKPTARAARSRSVKSRVSAAEWQLRCELAAAHRLIAHFVFVDMTYNHVSVRLPDNSRHFLVKPDNQFMEQVTASSLVKYDLDGHYQYGWGGPGGRPGQLNGGHQMTVDQENNLYIAEVFGGRVQKFRPKAGADPAKIVGPGHDGGVLLGDQDRPPVPREPERPVGDGVAGAADGHRVGPGRHAGEHHDLDAPPFVGVVVALGLVAWAGRQRDDGADLGALENGGVARGQRSAERGQRVVDRQGRVECHRRV